MVGRAIKLLSCVVLMLSATARNVPAGRSILPFTDDLDQALEQAASAGKPVVLVFIAVWCPNCQRMEKTTFTDPVIARHADDLVWVMVDIDRHLALAHQYNVEAVPVTFLLDPGGQRRASLVGLVGAAQLDAQLATML
ncbi:MAG: thioredoxin family protein, partial [Acidobacteriota bacterium]